MAAKKKDKSNEPEVLNRRAYHDYFVSDTLEVGIKLVGTEVRSIRAGRCAIGDGYVRAEADPPRLTVHGLHIDEYAAAGPPSAGRQHALGRTRTLLAHKREIVKLARASDEKGVTIIPLKLYFKDGRVKLLIGLARGKAHHDKRQDIKKREADRDIRRAMSKRR